MKDGEYCKGKGYYWKGRFINNNSDPQAFELGYHHGKSISKNLTKREIKKLIKIKPANLYEEGKIKALRDFLEGKMNIPNRLH